MLKRILNVGVFLGVFLHCQAQSGSFGGGFTNFMTKPDVPNLIPASPNAAAIEKFGSIPVSYSTGVPSISYPMWSWKRGKLSFNIGLSYHAGGHKVQDMASHVGLGWALNAGGRISRTVRGVPDDLLVRGFMYSAVLPQASTYAHEPNIEYVYTSPFVVTQQGTLSTKAINDHNTTYFNEIKQISDGWLDGEQDIFSYSVNGYSGRFIFDKGKNIIHLEKTNVKIEAAYSSYHNGQPNGHIVAFTLTDDQGLQYTFDVTDLQNAETVSSSNALTPNFTHDGITGWLLSEIQDLNNGEAITLAYTNSNTTATVYETGFSQSQTYALDKHDETTGQQSDAFDLVNDVYSYSKLTGQDKTPSLITLPDGSTIAFEYQFSRADLLHAKALTKVIVKNAYAQVIKQFALDYSYFTNSVADFTPPTQNDYSRRLRLDRVRELSNNSSLEKPTTFTYNAVELNARNSRNLDYWGYNVNPARANLTYVPNIKINEGTPLNDYLPGGDRRPDPEFVKAALLEKIDYPTGGYTQFEYECNRAFSAVDYFENELSLKLPEWVRNDFGMIAYDIPFFERAEEPVKFLLKAQEFEPRPEPDENGPYSCFVQSQDNMTVTFTVYSTDNAYIQTYQNTYGNLVHGVELTLNLPLNKDYKIIFNYNSYAQCAFVYEFKVTGTVKYKIDVTEKLAGGARIRKITSYDGTGVTLTKSFDYNLNGKSSGVLTDIPNYGFYKSTQQMVTSGGAQGGHIANIRLLNRSSNPAYSINYYQGSPLIYTRVREIEADGSFTERHYDPAAYQGGNYNRYPYPPVQDFSNFSGLLKKEIIKDASGNTQSETEKTYTKTVQQQLNGDNRNLRTGTIGTSIGYNATYYAADQFFPYITHVSEASALTKVYENGQESVQSVSNTYDPAKLYLRTRKTANSKGEEIVTAYSYPFDQTGSLAFTAMVQKNMLAPILSTSTYKSLVLNGELGNSVTTYALFHNGALVMPSLVQGSLLGGSLEDILSYDKYDTKGNLLQYTGSDGVVTSFLWGYNLQHPVAKIVGKSHADVEAQFAALNFNVTVLLLPVSDATLRSELQKLRGLSNCWVTTYTYKPLVGVTSETDPNGLTTYYEYDGFNRLYVIRDAAQNVLKKFCYNYSGQPQDCGIDFTPQWVATGEVRCKPCSSNTSYSTNIQEHREKDNNPNNPASYRWVEDGPHANCTAPQDWQYFSEYCEVDAANVNTGNKVIVEKNMNPCSLNPGAFRNSIVANSATCPTPPGCGVCTDEGYKCIDGVCELGIKVYSCSYNPDTGMFNGSYHYEFSDGTWSDLYLVWSPFECQQ